MRILKNVTLVLLVCAIGAGLGYAVFRLQNPDSKTAEDTMAPEAASSPTPTERAYQNTETGVIFSLPANLLVQEVALTGFSAGMESVRLKLLRLSGNSTSAEETSTSVYILQSSPSDPGFAAAQSKLQKQILTKTASQTTTLETAEGVSVTKKSYSSPSGGGEVSYEISNDTTYILIHRAAANTANPSVKDEELNLIQNSLKLKNSTPTTTNSPLL